MARAFVRFFRAARQTDSSSSTGSRLFGGNPLSILAEKFFQAFLNHLASDDTLVANTQDEWVKFLKDPKRQFDVSDWSLPLVSPGATQPNHAYKNSQRAAEVTFSKFFSTPDDLESEDPASWLLGPGMIEVQTAVQSPAGRFPRTNYQSHH